MQYDARAQGPTGPAGPAGEPIGQGGQPRHRHRYRSLFWPVIFIAAGVVWLLFSLDVLSDANARMLSVLWPILVVGIGVDLLLGRRSLALGALVGAVTAGLIIVFMAVGPGAGWVKGGELKTEPVSTPVGQATAAEVTLKTGAYSLKVHALPGSAATDRPLLAGTVNYRGALHFDTTGGTKDVVSLSAEAQGWWLPWFDHEANEPWDIGIDSAVPLALAVDMSSGSSDLDLSGMTLTRLQVDMSSGKTKATLPAQAMLDASVHMSSGDAEVWLGSNSDGKLDFEGSSGQFTLHLAEGQAYRIEVQRVSSGDVHLPDGLARVDTGHGKEGTWETQGYSSAAGNVVVTIRISSGDVKVRQGS